MSSNLLASLLFPVVPEPTPPVPRSGNYGQVKAKILAALEGAPRTIQEISSITGIHDATIGRGLRQLLDANKIKMTRALKHGPSGYPGLYSLP